MKQAILILFLLKVWAFFRDIKERLEVIRNIRACGTKIFENDKIDTEAVDDELLISAVQAFSQIENDWRSENIIC